jgi:hypothetical protein
MSLRVIGTCPAVRADWLQIAIGKLANYVQQVFVEACKSLFFDVRKNAFEIGMSRMSDPTSNTSDGVAVAANSLVIGRFEECR